MNIQQMRKTDYYVGGIICLFLDIFERIRRVFSSEPASPEIKRILVTKYLGMGSILLATPTLRALRERYPGSRIVFLTFAGNADFARRIGLVDDVLAIKTSPFPTFVRNLAATLLTIRREKFDVVFDLEFFARFSTIVSYLSRAPIRVGYYLPKLWRGDLLTHQIHFNPYRHVTEIFAAQLAPFGIEVTDFTLVAPEIREESISGVQSLLRKHEIREDERIIAVNVNASELSKERRWPRENFVELVKAFAEKKCGRVVLVGSPDEAEYVRSVHDSLPGEIKGEVVDLSGKLNLEDFIALIRTCSLFISNDSGPLHIASALGIPTVSFYGPESPHLYGPVGSDNLVFYAGVYCSPCLNVYNAKRAMCNGDNRCIQEIKPEEVINVLREKGIL